MASRDWPTRDLFGIPVRALTMNEVLDVVDVTIGSRERLLIGVINAAKVVNMRRDPLLGQAVLTADMILADGASVVGAAKILRRPLPERVAGVDLMTRIMERGKDRGYRVYCLGATDEVLAEVVEKIKVDYPGVQLAGARNGYFNDDEEEAIAEQIADSNADVLFAAMSSPKKERFLAKWSERMGVPVCHGVGGAFDVMAGKVKRAPESWQRLGLEWLYRIVQEPRRMWKRYLVTNTLFMGMLVGEMVGMGPRISETLGVGKR